MSGLVVHSSSAENSITPSEIVKNVLVTGGAGYIGTQTCKALSEAGFQPIVYDNLVHGYEENVRWGKFFEGDFSKKKLRAVFEAYKPIMAVVHLAAFKAVGESVEDPAKYYENNFCGTVKLLKIMREKGVDKIIFSSTASVYGLPTKENTPFVETDRCAPMNPYGNTKLGVERVLMDYAHAVKDKVHYVAFRYFNVAGADLEGECGDRGTTPHNLIPIILQVAGGKRNHVEILGTDYENSDDGTAIRDYVHVVDVADVHVKALQYLLDKKPSVILNIGTGEGKSVKQVIDMARSITKKPIAAVECPRRPGDPPFLVANASLAEKVLGWKAQHSDLEKIISSEWKWYQSLHGSSQDQMKNFSTTETTERGINL